MTTETPTKLELDEGQRELLVTTIVGQVKTQIGEAVKTALTDQVGPLAQRLEQMEAKIGEIGKNPPKPDDKNKNGKTGDDDPDDGVLATLNESIAKLAEKVDAIAGERAEETKSRRVASLVETTLKDKKLSGLLKKPGVLARIREAVAKGEKPDADAVMAAVEAEKAYAQEMGLDVKSFGADPEGEGAEKPGGADDQAARVEAIRKAEKPSL